MERKGILLLDANGVPIQFELGAAKTTGIVPIGMGPGGVYSH